MKKIPQILLALSLGAATVLSAQTTNPTPTDGPRGPRRGGPGGHGRHFNAIVCVVDADKNGELSGAEIANAAASIRTLDANTDGTVAKDELHPPRPADAATPPAGASQRPPHAPKDTTTDTTRTRPVDPIMLALDANSDGALATAEIANATASLLVLDLNKDGKLTPDELRPLPPAT